MYSSLYCLRLLSYSSLGVPMILNISYIYEISFYPSKSGLPIANSAKIHPTDHMSTGVAYVDCKSTSGARYHNVTTWGKIAKVLNNYLSHTNMLLCAIFHTKFEKRDFQKLCNAQSTRCCDLQTAEKRATRTVFIRNPPT